MELGEGVEGRDWGVSLVGRWMGGWMDGGVW